MTNKDALEAFERIASDAVYGIGSGDYEIMNKGGFDKDMERHNLDAAAVRSALEVNQELVEALRAISTLKDMAESVVGMVDYPYKKALDKSVFLAKQAIAKAEAVGGDNE